MPWIAIWNFIKSPVGRALGAALLVILLLSGTYVKGRADGSAACEARHDKAVVQEVVRQAAVVEVAAGRAVEAAKQATDNMGKAKDALDAAKALPNANSVCVPASVTDRLRAIH